MEEIVSMITSIAVKLIIAGATAVVTCYVIPWLKEKKLYDTVTKFVKAAEKLAESSQLGKQEKKRYVLDLLSRKGIQVTPIVEAMIESAVTELDIAVAKSAERGTSHE